MIELILISIIPTSLSIYAVHILFQKYHLLAKAGRWMRVEWPKKFPEKYRKTVKKINKPLFQCEICMSSTYGTLWYFVLLEFLFGIDLPFKLWVPFVFFVCGANTIINKLVSKERIIIDE